MDAVAASLIGFAVLGLRRPNVFGTIVGAVFVGILLNGLTMLNAPSLFVSVSRTRFVSRLVIVTVAPGTTAPWPSLTTPTTLP